MADTQICPWITQKIFGLMFQNIIVKILQPLYMYTHSENM